MIWGVGGRESGGRGTRGAARLCGCACACVDAGEEG